MKALDDERGDVVTPLAQKLIREEEVYLTSAPSLIPIEFNQRMLRVRIIGGKILRMGPLGTMIYAPTLDENYFG